MMGILGALAMIAGFICLWVGLLSVDHGYLLPVSFILLAGVMAGPAAVGVLLEVVQVVAVVEVGTDV